MMPGDQTSLESAYGGSPADNMTDGELVDVCEHEGTPLMYCDAIRVRMADHHLRIGTLAQEIKRLREALATARSTIRAFHGEAAWPEYQNSPEMQQINAALRGGGE